MMELKRRDAEIEKISHTLNQQLVSPQVLLTASAQHVSRCLRHGGPSSEIPCECGSSCDRAEG